MSFPLTRSVLDAGVAARAFPAATIEVGRAAGPLWHDAVGALRYEPDAPAATPDTIFDLASLTKVIATSSLAMRHVAAGRLDLDGRLADRLPGWHDGERASITIGHLLEHASGLPAHARLWEHARGRAEFEADLAALPLESSPGTRSIYSDVGFMLLGFVLEDVGGAPLHAQMNGLSGVLGLGDLQFLPPDAWRDRTAPTEFESWRHRLLVGEVHDENCSALGGVAGHAGLFGTAGAVGRFARGVLAALARGDDPSADLPLMRRFATRTAVPGSSRALGWDTMLPTSSCGTRLSSRAIGHTGFTGTSLWIDPEQDLYVVLLTNRVYPTRANEALRAIRPRVHDAVIEDLERPRGLAAVQP